MDLVRAGKEGMSSKHKLERTPERIPGRIAPLTLREARLARIVEMIEGYANDYEPLRSPVNRLWMAMQDINEAIRKRIISLRPQ